MKTKSLILHFMKTFEKIYSPSNAPAQYSTQWLYNLVAEKWPKLIFPNGNATENVQETIRKGGYYTVKIMNGLRVVVLNNNVCYRFNWWVVMNPKRLMFEQLDWLQNVLFEAEKNHEFVHILMHISPGTECYYIWNREYHRIITRYSHIVKAQFCGHTHFEELKLMENKKGRKIGAIFTGGSLTTYRKVRPNYRIFEVNPRTADIEDFVSYTMAIDNNDFEWKKFYSFKEFFGVDNLNVTNLEEAFNKMKSSIKFAKKYVQIKYKNSTPWTRSPCNRRCLAQQISEIPVLHPN